MKRYSLAKYTKRLGQKIACQKKVSRKKGLKIAKRMFRTIVRKVIVGESIGISCITKKGVRLVMILVRVSRKRVVILRDTREVMPISAPFSLPLCRDQIIQDQ